MWPLLEPQSHQALAAEMLFQEVWRIKQEEKGSVSEEPGKGAGLRLEQAWAQGKAVISVDRKGIQERQEGPRLSGRAQQGQPARHITLNPGAIVRADWVGLLKQRPIGVGITGPSACLLQLSSHSQIA